MQTSAIVSWAILASSCAASHNNLLGVFESLQIYSFSQQSQCTIVGTVTDSETGEPLVGASVTIHGNREVTADLDGNFSFTNLSPGNFWLQASFVGYDPVTSPMFWLKSDQLGIMNVKLVPMKVILEEVN